jgi:hypothetical protein
MKIFIFEMYKQELSNSFITYSLWLFRFVAMGFYDVDSI